MKQYLNLDGEFYIVNIVKKGNGIIQVNSINPEFQDGEWNGTYISDYPITISAFPSKGYIFKGWSEDIISNEETIIVSMDKDITIKANFEKSKQ